MKLNKVGISPVVATALLLIVSVVAVVGFQNWYSSYSSDMFVKAERDSSQTSQTNIETLIGDQLFFKNTLGENVTIKQIKLGTRECNISVNVTTGVHNISLGDCATNLTLDSNVGDIVVITDRQVYTKKHLFKDVKIDISQSVSTSVVPSASTYELKNSLLFNGSGDYLTWTPSQEGNRTTWTWSGWIKKNEEISGNLMSLFTNNQYGYGIYLQSDSIILEDYYSSTMYARKKTVETYINPSDFMNVIVIVNTSANIESERMKLYVEGKRIIWFQDSSQDATTTWPIQNHEFYNINTLTEHSIGKQLTYYSDMYLSEINFIDGQALTPENFGEFNQYGKWVPKEYNGTYGQNGFHLTFENSSNLGQDFSGNNNSWTVNGNPIQTKDNPTNNFATLNPLVDELAPLSEGNLVSAYYTGGNNIWKKSPSTIGTGESGKYYWEVKLNKVGGGYPMLGAFRDEVWSGDEASDTAGGRYQFHSGPGFGGYVNGVSGFFIEGVMTDSSFSAGINDIVAFALDLDNLKVDIYINNILNKTYSNLTKGQYYPTATHTAYYDTEVEFNFGATNFTYTPPTGYKTLSSKSLPIPTIIPSKGFDILTYTGNSMTRNISGLDFSPSLVWLKNRNQTDSHKLFDILRGPTNYIESDTTDIETADVNSLTSFNSGGFALGTGTDGFNDLNEEFVAWNWKEGSEFGFNIVNYTGDSIYGRNISHNLGEKPELIITKDLTQSSVVSWNVYHNDLSALNYLTLNNNDAVNNNPNRWADTEPNSTHFTLGGWTATNELTHNYISYLFTSIEGFSKIGSYTGNGNVDGPFIYTGFKPKYVLIKNSDNVGFWVQYDSLRNQFNPVDKYLQADTNSAEGTLISLDFISNGFKIRTDGTTQSLNTNGDNYIYIAFAEYPLSTNQG